MGETGVTPIRRQYLRVKQRFPEAIVLFRLGDFYETFDEDAHLVSRLLEITLTSREMGKGHRIPMAGIPHHALENYLARLISRGHKVAICEQLTPPGRGLVERDVVRVVTPGTVVEPGLLEAAANNYLVSVVADGDRAGLAYVDITTSEFATTQVPLEHLAPELERLHPSEVLVPRNLDLPDLERFPALTRIDELWSDLDTARQGLLDHFGAATLEGYGCAQLPLAVRAAGAIVRYLQENQKGALGLLTRLSTYSTGQYMLLDAQTRRNLELFQSSRQGTVAGSILSVIDLTRTPMGGRLLKKWLGYPLLDLDELTQRQEAVERFHQNHIARGRLTALLHRVGDLERLVNRVRGGQANPKELVALRRGLEVIPEIRTVLAEAGAPEPLAARVQPCEEVTTLIAGALADDPPVTTDEGGVIRPGFSADLDELRERVQGCQAVPGQPGAAGAGADRGQVAEGRLQPGLRLLHRGQPGQYVLGPGRLHPQADPHRRRALLHHGAQGV